MKTIVFSLLLLLTQPAYALLAPLNQGLIELKRVIESDELIKALPPSQKIEAIIATERGYLLRTQMYQMRVDVNYQPQEKPGPAPFKLIFHKPTEYPS